MLRVLLRGRPKLAPRQNEPASSLTTSNTRNIPQRPAAVAAADGQAVRARSTAAASIHPSIPRRHESRAQGAPGGSMPKEASQGVQGSPCDGVVLARGGVAAAGCVRVRSRARAAGSGLAVPAAAQRRRRLPADQLECDHVAALHGRHLPPRVLPSAHVRDAHRVPRYTRSSVEDN